MLKKTLILIVAIVVVLTLTGCKPQGETSMYVVEGSLPTSFDVDESLPSTAKICVVSGAGDRIYAITPDMVEGFDTSLSTYGEKKTMVIKHNSLSVQYQYTVDGDVNTRARLDVLSQTQGGTTTVSIGVKNLSEDDGMIAMQFFAEVNNSTCIVKGVDCMAEGYKVVTHQDGTRLGIVVYAESADDRLQADAQLVQITYERSYNSDIMLTISGESGYIEMTEGKGTKHLPTHTVMI